MANSHDATRREPSISLGSAGNRRHGGGDWIEPEKAPRDWKKLFLVFGLGALSWVATYVGMLELIESNMGDLPFVHQVIIGFSVAMLMTMIIWLLDQIFSPVHFTTKVVYVFGYLFLTLISVGFGFGFYWKVLESRGEATRSAESAISQVQTSLHAGSIRIEQLSETLGQLTQISTAKAIEEREKGTSCPNSRPGDGPRRKLRDSDAQSFAFAGDFVSGRIASIKAEMSGLDADMAKVTQAAQSTVDPDSGNRNEFMRALNRRLDMTVAGFNAFRGDPQLGQIRSDLAARAEQAVFPNGAGGTFACPDPQLQTALRGVVRAIDQLPVMQRPQVAAVEGAEATIEAFRRLSATLQGALVFQLPPSADELRALQQKAVQSLNAGAPAPNTAALAEPAGLSKRDYIPLAIAVFVDFCLLLVSIGRPINRLNGLVPVMREAERGPMIKILSRFNDIHRDPEIRQNFEVFRHVVFDMHGAYYVAVPLDAPYRPSGRGGQAGFGYGSSDAQELQHEAHLLANLFSGFEQQKIFSRVYNPFLTTKAVQKKLWRQGSKFAGCQAFRVYRFRDGAWSDMILQAVMGAARRAEEEKRIRLEAEAEARANEPPARVAPEVPAERADQRPAWDPRTAASARDPLRGFDTGLRLAPDVDARRHANGSLSAMRSAHPGAMRDDEATHANVEAFAGAGGVANGANRSVRRAAGASYAVNGAATSKRRRPARTSMQTEVNDSSRDTEKARPRTGQDDQVLRSAFGRYAPSAAAEFSVEETGFDAAGDAVFDPVAIPANGNTAPRNLANGNVANAKSVANPAPAGINASHVGDDVVIALSDKRQTRIASADVAMQTTVTLMRETATFALPSSSLPSSSLPSSSLPSSSQPSSDQRLTNALATARAIEFSPPDAGVEQQPQIVSQALYEAEPQPTPNEPVVLTPPPLPAWARKPATDIEVVADSAPVVVAAADPVETAAEVAADVPAAVFTAALPDDRWALTSPTFELTADEQDDETIVTIAHRLRPNTDTADV